MLQDILIRIPCKLNMIHLNYKLTAEYQGLNNGAVRFRITIYVIFALKNIRWLVITLSIEIKLPKTGVK